MSHAWNRAEHYCDLAEECRRLAETTLSTPMRRRFWRMAEYYSTLAKAEGSGYTSLRRFATSLAPTTVRPLRTERPIQTHLIRNHTKGMMLNPDPNR